ncbi:penicillin-binding protein, transpeptidase domain protein [Leptospira inadai serovar Lyme str. 10]|uniref:Penicillin-binding protein, transpeptidase domain protein n=2 Tax=Leptospira inadai serovar Lyme TaxID=293084 RepID=V6HS20_9LEPT|nr:penicillin-binding protein [Leptospira inadai]EQA35354.1 penicillin-binding protein, transpeptidase domain protein [Leptospira inadai serovar Lyme str. 10]PNV73959.1 penicillin-binding protein [Leptospira inadai serovar Lyme]
MHPNRKRFSILFYFLCVLFAILTVRVSYLIFFNDKEIAFKNGERILRGAIYDRRGIELALSIDSSTIGIYPANIYDPNFTAIQLSPYLDLSPERIEGLIREKSRYFLLKREIDDATATRIMEMALPGVRREREFKRVYPHGSLAASLVGFTGMDDDKALSGLEYYYNRELMTPTDSDPNRGANVHLTLDGLIQFKLEKALGKRFEETGAKRAVGLLMEIHTGKILAMASFPSFDPNRYATFEEISHTNWAIRHVYEPGSTMKIFLASILLNENLIRPNEKFDCPGYVEYGKTRIKCTQVHGKVNLEEILQYSCNAGIIKASSRIPNEVLYEYMKRFRFGDKTGLLPNESVGYIPTLNKWTPTTPMFMAIGQGMSVTPVQLVASAASVVNGGRFLTPRVVSHITDSYGEVLHEFKAEEAPVGIREYSTERLLKAMTKVVRDGTGKNAYIQEYSIAGKTGTGQKSVSGRGYQDGLWSASFLGFFPAEKPKIVGLILFDEPRGSSHTGGGLAAPVFKEVVENIIPIIEQGERTVDVRLPKLDRKNQFVKFDHVPDLTGKSKREVVELLSSLGVPFKLHGSGFCYEQDPSSGTSLNGKRIDVFFQ